MIHIGTRPRFMVVAKCLVNTTPGMNYRYVPPVAGEYLLVEDGTVGTEEGDRVQSLRAK